MYPFYRFYIANGYYFNFHYIFQLFIFVYYFGKKTWIGNDKIQFPRFFVTLSFDTRCRDWIVHKNSLNNMLLSPFCRKSERQ